MAVNVRGPRLLVRDTLALLAPDARIVTLSAAITRRANPPHSLPVCTTDIPTGPPFPWVKPEGRGRISQRTTDAHSPLVPSGDEISGDAGYRSPSGSARRSFVPSAKRARADPPGDTSEVA